MSNARAMGRFIAEFMAGLEEGGGGGEPKRAEKKPPVVKVEDLRATLLAVLPTLLQQMAQEAEAPPSAPELDLFTHGMGGDVEMAAMQAQRYAEARERREIDHDDRIGTYDPNAPGNGRPWSSPVS
jgi:hypothetical protein